MNEDYLWDKTGEPDAEIERLEKQLGQLRFKRPTRPLSLPETTRWTSKLSFSPALAIAATLLLLLLAGGLWLSLRRPVSTGGKNLAETNAIKDENPGEQVVSGPRPPIGPEVSPNNKKQQPTKLTASVPVETASRRNILSRRHSASRQMVARLPENKVTATPRREEMARGENAKAQLILALHIASDKLNAVQKKIQVNPGT
jgi:hypothetical protein